MSVETINPIKEFQADHKLVRDLLFEIIEAAEERNAEKALESLLVLDSAGGPHFRFEEESLYPALEQFFGKEEKKAFLFWSGLIKFAKEKLVKVKRRRGRFFEIN